MFEETTDILTKIEEMAMDAQLPVGLPTKMKEKFLELSHNMTTEQIQEVGRKFREARKEAFDKFNEELKKKEQNKELLAQRMSSRH